MATNTYTCLYYLLFTSMHVFALLDLTQSYVTNITIEYLRNRPKSILNISSMKASLHVHQALFFSNSTSVKSVYEPGFTLTISSSLLISCDSL